MDYAAVNRFAPTLAGLTVDTPVRTLALYFAVHLRTTRFTKLAAPVKSVTIDQYITHVADALVTDEHILRGTDLRSNRLTMLLEEYAREDDRGPLRLAQKIPVTYPIACTMQRWADKLHTGGQRLATRAAVAVAYGLSLRPGEYLTKPDVELSLDKQMNASDCFFVFNDDECVNVCDPQSYPVGRTPSVFLCMFRKLKHYKRSGEGGPRAVGARPASATAGFCCVLTLFEYFTKFPGKRDTLALTAHGARGVPWADIRALCHCAAIESGLDPLRLLPHSLRVAAQAQLEMECDERRQQQGGWNSEAGMKVYARKALGHARIVAAALHDPQLCPIEQTRMLFNDHSVVAVAAAADARAR